MRVIYIFVDLIFMLILHTCNGEYTCDADWKLVGDTCVGVFMKTEEKTSWFLARDKCHKLNSTLATIRNQNKQTLLSPVFRGDAWIDLSRDSSSDEFQWANGDPKLDYTSWQSGQPNNGGEGCAVILAGYSRGYWADKPCFNKYYYICEGPAGTSRCKENWVPLAGKCYAFSNTSATWYESRESCRKNGSDLVVIETEFKNSMLRDKMYSMSQMRYRTHWIGATDAKEEGKWTWLDETEEMTYRNWSNGSPDNGGNGIHACVYMPSTYRSDGAWKTQDCNVNYPAVCERKPVNNNGTATCEDDWKLYENESCIIVNLTTSSWAGSRKRCKQLGGDLVVVKTSTKSRFVRRFVVNSERGRTGWIGLHDGNLDAKWTWLDETEETPLKDWYSGYPRENLMRNYNCVFMRSTSASKGRWANALCTIELAYICEMPVSGQCDSGWHSFGGNCYRFNYDVSGWHQARERCKVQNPNADLVVVDNYPEQMWLKGKFDKSADVSGFWIGLNSFGQKNVFVWLNTTANAGYTNWDARMPSYLKNEACAVATGSYRQAQWKDEPCDENNGYLCEKPAGGDASYYDFRYNGSVYKLLLTRFTRDHGDQYCKKVLGTNATLIVMDGEDETNYIMKELDARGHVGSNRFWTRGKVDDQSGHSMTTTQRSSSSSYRSRLCIELSFEAYGPWDSRKYRPKLQQRVCCDETYIICEKRIDEKTAEANKYDFALNTSIYRLMDDEMLTYNDSSSRCAKLLDNSGSLAEFETWDELEAVSREVLARHIGEHFIYWVAGDPLNDTTFSVVPKSNAGSDEHCLILEYDPANLKMTTDPTMTLRPTSCAGRKKFLCERKGVKIIGSNIVDWDENWDTPGYAGYYGNSGCTGSCVGLAVALPFVAIGAVLITVAYFWFIRRQSPLPVKFNQRDDEVRLTM